MPKRVLDIQKKLFYRLDMSYREVATEEMKQLMTQYPEFCGPNMTWGIELIVTPNVPYAMLNLYVIDNTKFYLSPGIIIWVACIVALIMLEFFH